MKEQGLCNENECRCGFSLGSLGKCTKGEICHANNPLFILGDILSHIPIVSYVNTQQQCTNINDHPLEQKNFIEEDIVHQDDPLFKVEIEAAKKAAKFEDIKVDQSLYEADMLVRQKERNDELDKNIRRERRRNLVMV